MGVYRLDIHYRRTVTAYIEAEDESDIDDFLTANPEFDLIQDYSEMIEGDETTLDVEEDNDSTGYDLTPISGITAGWTITPGLQLVERD